MLVITETSFLYAVVDKNDLNYKIASGFLKNNPELTYVIPFSTLLQVSSLIGNIISRKTQMLFLKNIKKNFNIEMHEHCDIERAFQIYEYCYGLNINDIDLSEALFISVCERLKTNNILTFREDAFSKIMPMGFKSFNFLI